MMDAKREWHDLLFAVRRSIRYHIRRRRFFETWHLGTMAVALIFSSAAVASVLGLQDEHNRLGAWLAAVVAVVTSLELVIGTSRKARLHDDLARRFIVVEKAMILVGEPDAVSLRAFTAERLGIEADEPPIYRVLDVMCRNELMRAMGYRPEQLSPVTWLQRRLAHFMDYGEHKLRDVSAA
jgi:hypothetical protein